MKSGRAKMLRKIVKSKCRRDVVHSKREERRGKDTIKVTMGFGLAKALSQRQGNVFCVLLPYRYPHDYRYND